MRLAWQHYPVCRICGTAMQREIVTYSAPDGEGKLRRYQNVYRYACPNGCTSGYYDFRHAYVQPSGPAGRALRLERRQRAAWAVTTVLVALGLIALYALFMYAIGAMPIGRGWVRIALWAVTTVAFLGIAALLALPPRALLPASTGARPAGEAPASPGPDPARVPAPPQAPAAAAGAQQKQPVGAAEAGSAASRTTGA